MRVSIGVPVYNGADSLEECLTVIQKQTFEDFEVHVFDNASDDRTPEIARRFAHEDSRFKYHRHSVTKEPQDNFRDCVAAAGAPYFMWRAHDDISSLNYIDHLVSILDDNPDAALAVSDGKWIDYIDDYEKTWTSIESSARSEFRKLLYQTKYFAPYWWYGLYRTDALRAAINENWHWPLYHADMIFLTHFASAGQVASRPGAMFYFRRLAPKSMPFPTDYATMSRIASLAVSTARRNIRELPLPWYQKVILNVAFLRMIDRKVVRFKKLGRAWFGSAIGG